MGSAKIRSRFEHKVFVWADMPRQNDAYQRCSIYLYPSKESADKGEDAGGSGCLVNVQSETDPYRCKPHLYAVTNRHVILEGSMCVRYNTMPDGSDAEDLEGAWVWNKHDDLAVAPIELPDWARYMSISLELFAVDQKFIADFNVGIGDDVFMVGRHVGADGKERNKPSFRFGNISMMPDADEPIELDDGKKQEAYLVEMRSMSGYSGSPVFFYVPMHNVPENRWTERRGWAVGPHLLGIHCAGYTERFPVRTQDGEKHPQGLYVRPSGGMAAVIPVWRLEKLLNTRDLVMARREKDEKELERQSGNKRGGFELESKKPEQEEFSRDSFEEALRRASRKTSTADEDKGET